MRATSGLTPRERVLKILKLLGDGVRPEAQVEAEELVREDPNNALGQILLSQIIKDPHELLGEKHFAYKIQSGESLSILAERYLGDRFLFYALARYNGIEAPNKAEVGQTIQIPGEPSRAAAPRRRAAETEAEAVDARLGQKSAPPPQPPPPPRKRDPARAHALRGRALVLLNSGAASRAVELLKEALEADPENAAVKRDLARAERIAGGGQH
jgi:LysM repeat protein